MPISMKTKYIYKCNGKTITLTNEETEYIHSRMLHVVHCNKCCNIPVLHLLEKMIKFTYLKTPLNKYTFRSKKIKNWVEENCEGLTLNLFAGKTLLNINEIRNDIREEMPADYHMDALEFVKTINEPLFNTVLLDPPYAYRKSMEMYNGAITSPFNKLKNAIVKTLKPNGIVITFGYHSVSMGKGRGFKQEHILLLSHGGAIHDTIAIIERKV